MLCTKTKSNYVLNFQFIKDMSGNKKNARLIYLAKYNNKLSVIKITSLRPCYKTELDINKYFNDLRDADDEIKNKIVKLESYEIVTLDSNMKYYDNAGKLLEDIHNIKTKHNTIIIMVLKKYATFNMYNKSYSFEKLHKIINNVINLVTYLHKKYRFTHWDLYMENILVNHKGEIKLIDFELSSVDDHENNIIYKRIGKKLDDNERLVKYINGYVYDLMRFFSAGIQYNKFITNYQKYLEIKETKTTVDYITLYMYDYFDSKPPSKKKEVFNDYQTYILELVHKEEFRALLNLL
jgi:thiamine kinase-like enzyme